jgi:hypothetical protein
MALPLSDGTACFRLGEADSLSSCLPEFETTAEPEKRLTEIDE